MEHLGIVISLIYRWDNPILNVDIHDHWAYDFTSEPISGMILQVASSFSEDRALKIDSDESMMLSTAFPFENHQ